MRLCRRRAAVVLAVLAFCAWAAAAGADINTGNRFLLAKEYDKAFEVFAPMAENGVAEAQYRLGVMHVQGLGTYKDAASGAHWIAQAARQGHALSQVFLAVLYYNGEGVGRNFTEAYFWSSLSLTRLTENGKQAETARKVAAASGRRIGARRQAEVRTRVDSWQPEERVSNVHPWAKEKLKGIGTGFFINSNGVLLTNAHVIAGCDKITVRHDGRSGTGTVEHVDHFTDLAVVQSDMGPADVVKLLDGPRPSAGTAVTLFGYAPRVSRDLLRSDGEIVNPHGYQDNTASMETSASGFSGQSGSPLLDRSGRLVGVVFGLKGSKEQLIADRVQGNSVIATAVDAVSAFLNRVGVAFSVAADGPAATGIADPPPFMAQLRCWGY